MGKAVNSMKMIKDILLADLNSEKKNINKGEPLEDSENHDLYNESEI